MSDAKNAVDAYFEMWNAENTDERARYIQEAWTSEAHYVDPLMEARGYDELSGMVTAVHQQFPGHRFRRTTEIDVHHDLLRFGWELVAPDGQVTAGGIDVGVISPDGKLRRIAGFLGPLAGEGAA